MRAGAASDERRRFRPRTVRYRTNSDDRPDVARIEEREALQEFGGEYRGYMQRVPAFIPRFGARREHA